MTVRKSVRSPKPGDRVGAVSHVVNGVAYVFGYGKYAGEELPVGAAGMGARLVEAKVTNPKIVLDSGKVVWGCECWWGLEKAVKDRIEKEKWTVVEIDIEAERAKKEASA